MACDHGGVEALKPNGGRIHQNMMLAEEKALLARFARAAGAGEMLNILISRPTAREPRRKYIGDNATKSPLAHVQRCYRL